VAAHSLGNMLVGSAIHDWGARPENYYMIDAAVPKEAYDPMEADDSAQDGKMTPSFWLPMDESVHPGTGKRAGRTEGDTMGDPRHGHAIPFLRRRRKPGR
jgi:hypothetical protein